MKKSPAFPMQANKNNLYLIRKILKEKIKMSFQLDMPLTHSSKVHQRITFNRKLKSKMFLKIRKKAAWRINGTKFRNLFTIKNIHKIMSKIKKDSKNIIKMQNINFSILKTISARDNRQTIITQIRTSKINILIDK
jgi:hypothetical protein